MSAVNNYLMFIIIILWLIFKYRQSDPLVQKSEHPQTDTAISELSSILLQGSTIIRLDSVGRLTIGVRTPKLELTLGQWESQTISIVWLSFPTSAGCLPVSRDAVDRP